MVAESAISIPPVAEIDAWQQRRARQYLSSFTRRMVPGFIGGRHIDDLTAALEAVERGGIPRLIVTMPPRHSKSLNVSENFPAWFLGRNPDKRLVAASHTAGLAYTFSRRVRNKIADPRYPFDIAIADDKGAVQAWDIAGHEGGYISVGVGGTPVGMGGHGIIIDDPIRSAADADSQTVRDALWEWYQGTLYNRRQPGAWIIVTATRWHEDDLTGRLLDAQNHGGDQWHHIHMPAISGDGAPLWPEYWPIDELDQIRRVSGSRAWEALYQGRPTPAEGGILKRHWLRYWQYPGQNLPHVEGSAGLIELPGYFDEQLQSWDLSFTKTQSGSYVAGLTAGRVDALCFLLDLFHERTDFPGTVEAFLRMTERWPDAVTKLVEDKANGPALMDTLRAHVPGITSVSPDGTKEARMHAVSPFVEGGGLVLPHPQIAPWVNDFVDEVTTFPMAAHDDRADALSQLLRRIMGLLHNGFDELDAYMARQLGRW